MKKTSTRRWLSNRAMIWMAALGLPCLGLPIWVIVNTVLVAQDRARFAQVSQEKSLIASRLADSLGNNVISTREQDECFNTEQGPWDNGNLWCQVASIIVLDHKVSYQDISSSYARFTNSMKWVTGTNAPFDGSWAMGVQGIKCQLQYKEDNSIELGLARRIPFDSAERNAVAVACADRARASYYPYSN